MPPLKKKTTSKRSKVSKKTEYISPVRFDGLLQSIAFNQDGIKQRVDNKVSIEFTQDLDPSQRLHLIAKLNEVIELETGAKLTSSEMFELKYQSKSTLFSSSGGTSSFGRCSG